MNVRQAEPSLSGHASGGYTEIYAAHMRSGKVTTYSVHRCPSSLVYIIERRTFISPFAV